MSEPTADQIPAGAAYRLLLELALELELDLTSADLVDGERLINARVRECYNAGYEAGKRAATEELDALADRYATAHGNYCGNAKGVLLALLAAQEDEKARYG